LAKEDLNFLVNHTNFNKTEIKWVPSGICKPHFEMEKVPLITNPINKITNLSLDFSRSWTEPAKADDWLK
jgi:hypothetical protein